VHTKLKLLQNKIVTTRCTLFALTGLWLFAKDCPRCSAVSLRQLTYLFLYLALCMAAPL